MPRRSGRPAKGENLKDSRQVIIDTAIALIKKKGADSITVRNVCGEADLSIGTFYHYFRDKDDLMMYFLRETSFDGFPLETALSEPGNRISELYMHLIRRYMELGLDFMKSFYSTSNRSLSAYMVSTSVCSSTNVELYSIGFLHQLPRNFKTARLKASGCLAATK